MLCSDFLNNAGHFILIIQVSTVHTHNVALHEFLLRKFLIDYHSSFLYSFDWFSKGYTQQIFITKRSHLLVLWEAFWAIDKTDLMGGNTNFRKGSKVSDQNPCRERLLTVRIRPSQDSREGLSSSITGRSRPATSTHTFGQNMTFNILTANGRFMREDHSLFAASETQGTTGTQPLWTKVHRLIFYGDWKSPR